MIGYIEYLNVPVVLGLTIIGVFLVMQIIGEVLEFKGKVVPEFVKIRKYFARKKQERQTMQEMSTTIHDVKTMLSSVESHYSSDNIAKRDSWMKWVNERAEVYAKSIEVLKEGTQEAAAVYYEHILLYPYQMYIHWSPSDQGNILFNDKRFVSLLYRWHNDEFTEYNKVSDAGSYIKDSIYDFIDDSQKVVIVVDCENSDPYKLSATLRRLNSTYTEKITSIILFDDIHTASAWSSLEKFTSVSVEHILIERIKQNKSLVDIRLTARACQEYYENNVDSFIIVSSDSDYWGLISSLPKAQFLVMIEHNKCGPDMKAALANSGIFYCYLDDFYSGDSEELKTNALLQEMRDYMEKAVQLNAIDMLNDALRSTRIEMTSAERQQFYDKYIKTLQLSINDDGKVSLVIKVK